MADNNRMQFREAKPHYTLVYQDNEKRLIFCGNKDCEFRPIEDLDTKKVRIKTYNGPTRAIQGLIERYPSYKHLIKNGTIKVYSVNNIITFEEVEVNYFTEAFELQRYIKTKRYSEVFDLKIRSDAEKRIINLWKQEDNGKEHWHIEWDLKNKYGVSQRYEDIVDKTASTKEDL